MNQVISYNLYWNQVFGKLSFGDVFPSILKTFFLYFGLKYSEYPGEGYGYGLAITGCLSVFNIGYFLYKVKDYNFD